MGIDVRVIREWSAIGSLHIEHRGDDEVVHLGQVEDAPSIAAGFWGRRRATARGAARAPPLTRGRMPRASPGSSSSPANGPPRAPESRYARVRDLQLGSEVPAGLIERQEVRAVIRPGTSEACMTRIRSIVRPLLVVAIGFVAVLAVTAPAGADHGRHGRHRQPYSERRDGRLLSAGRPLPVLRHADRTAGASSRRRTARSRTSARWS